MCGLSHAPLACARVNSHMLAGGLFSRTHIFVDGCQFSTFNLHIFLHPIHVFLITFMVVITYTTIPTYKYPSILLYFLTPYLFLSLVTLSPYKSSFFSFRFLHFGVKQGKSRAENRPILWFQEINQLGAQRRQPFGVKLNSFLFTPKTFYRG